MAIQTHDKPALTGVFVMLSFSDCAPMPIKAVPAFLQPHLGHRVSYATVFRWASKGVSGVRLQTLYVAGQRYTTPSAISDFLNASSAAKSGKPQQQTEKERQAYRARQKARAKALGL
jgi:hypothetical protein